MSSTLVNKPCVLGCFLSGNASRKLAATSLTMSVASRKFAAASLTMSKASRKLAAASLTMSVASRKLATTSLTMSVASRKLAAAHRHCRKLPADLRQPTDIVGSSAQTCSDLTDIVRSSPQACGGPPTLPGACGSIFLRKFNFKHDRE